MLIKISAKRAVSETSLTMLCFSFIYLGMFMIPYTKIVKNILATYTMFLSLNGAFCPKSSSNAPFFCYSYIISVFLSKTE